MSALEDFSKLEHALIEAARITHSGLLKNTKDLITLHYLFLDTNPLKDDKHQVFRLFWQQTFNSLSLSLLSAIRQHSVQSKLILRNALESAVLACYALFHASKISELNDKAIRSYLEHFGVMIEGGTHDLQGSTDQQKGALKNAYKWLKNEFPSESKILETNKKFINQFSAHANIHHANSFRESYLFDYTEKRFVDVAIWQIGDISLGLLSLFTTVGKQYGLSLQSVENFSEVFQTLSETHQNFKKGLEKHF